MEVLSVTFAHNYPTFGGLHDFEKLFIQCGDTDNNRERLLERFSIEGRMEDVSNVSSIKIYKHTGVNLSKKAKLFAEYPCTLEQEKRLLTFVKTDYDK